MFEYFPVDTKPSAFQLDRGADFKGIVTLWQSRRTGDGLPAWKDFNLTDFAGWHARMAVSEILPSRNDLKFQFFGSDMVILQGDDLTGAVLSERLPEAYDTLYRDHINCFTKSPVIAFGYVKASSDLDKSKRIAVMYLPLADDGQQIDRILHLTCWDAA